MRWPGGARLALWVCPNIEHYEFEPGPVRVRDPWPRSPHPDVLGYGLKDYGNRVGLWRMFETMDRYGIRCTVSLNLANFEHYPEIFEACERRGWDYMCHGVYNTQYLWGYGEDEERAFVADCVETFRRLTGRALEGWFSPAASHTLNTPDLVAEAGVRYYCDFYHDDQPFPVRVKKGRLITIPYQMDLNDAVLTQGSGEGEDFSAHGARHVRHALRRRRKRRPGDVHGDPPLSHGASAPAQISRLRDRVCSLSFGRLGGDRVSDRQLVLCARLRRGGVAWGGLGARRPQGGDGP